MKYSELTPAQIDAAMAEADEATGRMLAAMKEAGGYEDVNLVLVDTVTRAVFQSQCLARLLDIPPAHWVDTYLSVTATALMQFNYDSLLHQGKEAVAMGSAEGMARFCEYLSDAVGRMMTQSPDVSVPRKH